MSFARISSGLLKSRLETEGNPEAKPSYNVNVRHEAPNLRLPMYSPGTKSTALCGTEGTLLKTPALLSMLALFILVPVKAVAGPTFETDDPLSL